MSTADIGYIIAFISMFVGALSTFPFTDAAREWGSVATNHYRLIVAFVVLSIFCMLYDKISPLVLFTTPTAIQYLYLSSSGIIGLVIGDYFAFHSMAILGARNSTIFNTLAPGSAFVFGFLILGEDIGLLGFIGVVVSIGGMIWFLRGSGEAEDKAINIHEYGSVKKGIIFGVLSGLCQGFHITLSKKGLTGISPVHATWIRVAAATIAYFTLTLIQGKLKGVMDVIRTKKHLIFRTTYATIFGMVLSIILVMYSVRMAEVSVVQTILSLGPLIVVPMAYILYKERITFQTLLAATVTIAGVVILIWRDNILSWLHWH
jgi:drug/metabolite transporter (DMT)-like permease